MKSLYRWWCMKKARIKQARLELLLGNGKNILDVGPGNGALSLLIQQNGFHVTTLDVKNKCVFEGLDNRIYDSETFPFGNQSFDTALMITMLHHTNSPERVISEAVRTSDRLIIMEDVYCNSFQKYLTFFVDSIVNWEFSGHPHTNKTDREWRECFGNFGLELKEFQSVRFLLFFRQNTYVLEKWVE